MGETPTKAGAGFLGLSLMAILFLTLMPAGEWQWEPEKGMSRCLLCTAGATRDFLANILLFVPLGLAVAFRRHRFWAAVLFGALLSTAIETTQLVIPGRFSSLQDICSNTLGTLVGFAIAHSSFAPTLARVLGGFRDIWEQWKRPTPMLANVLAFSTALLTIGVFTVTGWLHEPEFPSGPYVFVGKDLDRGAVSLRVGSNGEQGGFFKGTIDEVRIYNRALAPEEIQTDLASSVGKGPFRAAPGLVAAFGFEEAEGIAILDGSGEGNDGLSEGVARVAGRFGSALWFDGRRAQVTIPSTPALDLSTGFSLEAWVCPEGPSSSWPAIIQKAGDRYFLYAGVDGTPVPRGGGTFGGANEGVDTPEPLTYGVWNHLATSYDGSELRLYVNGRRVAARVRWFQGRVAKMSVDNTMVSPGLVDTHWLAEALKGGGKIRLSGTAGPTTSHRAPVLDIRKICSACLDEDVLLLSAHRNDLVLKSFTRATSLGLTAREARFPRALAGIEAGSPLEIELSGVLGKRLLKVKGASYRESGYSLGSGWAFLIDSQYLPERFGRWLDVAWVAAWTLPIGFWSRTPSALLGSFVLLGGALWLLPVAGVFESTPPILWFATVLGLLMGTGVRSAWIP